MAISFMKNHQSLLLHLLLTEVKQAIRRPTLQSVQARVPYKIREPNKYTL